MNSKQRRVLVRSLNRQIEAYSRAECERLGLDPEQWATITLNIGSLRAEIGRVQNLTQKKA